MLPYIQGLILKDRIFLVLAITIAVSLLLVLVFAIFTVYLRFQNMRKAERWRQLEAEWEPLVLDFLVEERTGDYVRGQIRTEDRLYFVDFLLRFAQRLQGHEAEAIARLAEPYLPNLAQRLKKGDPPTRARAIRTLSILGLESYAENIKEALDDPSPLVAMIAARALTRIERPEYAEAILRMLHRFLDWSQGFLVSLFTSMGSSVIPPLRNSLSDRRKTPQVRSVAADALQELHDLEAGDLASTILETEDDRELRAACLRLLRVVGRPEHLPPIRQLAQSTDFVIRAHAFRALGTLGTEEDIAILQAGIGDESPWVALQAARSLKHAGGEQMLQELANTDSSEGLLAKQVLTEGSTA
jgi:HEAT repeat protein